MTSTKADGAEGAPRHRVPIRIDGGHPALPGHFPGRPVVPGVVVLDRLVQAAETELGRMLDVVGIPQVKFLAPLLPGEDAQGVFALDGARLRFHVECAGRVIVQGTFALADGAAAQAPASPR